MNRTWPAASLAFAGTLSDALDKLGRVDLARSAESSPAVRRERLERTLRETGALDLDAGSSDPDEAAAAAMAVRASGRVVAPWPLARAVAVPGSLRDTVDALYVVDGAVAELDHADLFERPLACRLDATAAWSVRVRGPVDAAPLDPFRVPVELSSMPTRPALLNAAGLTVVLDCLWIAGALATVCGLAAEYANDRRQFGRPIGSFGEIRWRIADMTVAADGLDEMAAFTWWLAHARRASLADVLALRVATHEAADVVLRNGHQVFGAIGLCEEHDLAVIDRHLTPALLRPSGVYRTVEQLVDAITSFGFDALFPVTGTAASTVEPSSPPAVAVDDAHGDAGRRDES